MQEALSIFGRHNFYLGLFSPKTPFKKFAFWGAKEFLIWKFTLEAPKKGRPKRNLSKPQLGLGGFQGEGDLRNSRSPKSRVGAENNRLQNRFWAPQGIFAPPVWKGGPATRPLISGSKHWAFITTGNRGPLVQAFTPCETGNFPPFFTKPFGARPTPGGTNP